MTTGRGHRSAEDDASERREGWMNTGGLGLGLLIVDVILTLIIFVVLVIH